MAQDAVYNPHAKPRHELPYIYGFNNGGSPGFFHGQLIAQDGAALGSHLCSHEFYMPGDLGVLEGSRADRHEHFKAHYPDGYQMAFVGYAAAQDHAGLTAALKANAASRPSEQAA